MNQESLRDLLGRVHERLSHSSGTVDPESRQLLTTVMSDIERALGEKPPQTDEGEGLGDRLEGLAVRFESGHPALAGVLRQLIDALGKAGI